MPTDLIKQVEAAKLLGVTRQYVNELVKGGKLKSYTVAKLVSLFEVETLKARRAGNDDNR